MEQYFIEHALKNVWGNPEQDKQYMIAGARITPYVGALNFFQLIGRKVLLPSKGKYYHVFQIGQINPNILGFEVSRPDWVPEKWVNLAECIESNRMLVSLYTKDGTCVPRYQSYYMWTNERNLIIAVETNTRVKIDYNVDQIYMRVYSNAWFETPEASSLSVFMRCEGKTMMNMGDILAYQAKVAAMQQRPGMVMCFVNGFYRDAIGPLTASIGDSVEYLYDSSVKRVVTFDVNSLNTFQSAKDNKNKYLLHYTYTGDATVDFEDDVDAYVLAPLAFDRFKGYFYHHNTTESKTMVTHRDYGIVVDYYDYIANKLKDDVPETTFGPRDFKLQLVVRRSGTNRALIYDNSRLFEMYKMDDNKILQAMVGVNSTLPMWKAENLENNAYTRLMHCPKRSDVTLPLVQQAYGYNSMSKIVGDTPMKTTLISGRQTVVLPEALVANCTVYEHDADGKLLGFYYHSGDRTYQAVNSSARLIEAISGKGTYQPDVRFGQNNIQLPVYDSYRVYMCFLVNGAPNNQWQDITGSNYYTVVNNVLVWSNLEFDQFLMVRSDKDFLAYSFESSSVNGNFFFTFTEFENRGNGVQLYPLPVPMGELDVYLNERPLIQGLDYVVDFPTVYITNKKYLNQPGNACAQRIHVRMTGFCSSDLKFEKINDYGFIAYGYLSNNNKHDIRDDKVLRITVDGKLKHRDDLIFSEGHGGVTIADPANGLPYQVKDIVVPLKQLSGETTYSFRAKSQVIDDAVSAYMSINYPQPDRGDLNVIPSKYPLVSTFVARILDALLSDEITKSQAEGINSDADLIMLCHPFEYALTFDPVNEDLDIDYSYVDVHPHHNVMTVNVQLYQYKFLSDVVRVYCRGLITLSPFFTVSTS